MLRARGVLLRTKDGLPSDGWVRGFMDQFSDRFEPATGGNIARMAGYRLAASGSPTRVRHFDMINDILETHPIKLIINSDETATGAASIKAAMSSRKLRRHFTGIGKLAHLPAASMSGHTSFLASIAVMVEELDSLLAQTPAEQVPGLHVFQSMSSLSLPANIEDTIAGSFFTIQENGSVTLPIFMRYIQDVLIPYIERTVPGGLLKGVREALITCDMPKVHNIPSWLRQLLASKGIHMYCFPHNSTSWSQALDNRHGFGAFKPEYYNELDKYLLAVALCSIILYIFVRSCLYQMLV